MKLFSISLVLAFFLAGCRGGANEAALRNEAIKDFNAGHVKRALTKSRDLRAYNAAASDFLVGQVMVFTAMTHGGAFSLLKPHYERMIDIDLMQAGELGSSRVLAAKTFAQIHWGGRDRATADLIVGCSRIGYSSVGQCAESLVKDAMKSYYLSGNNMDRVYLMEASSVSIALAIGRREESNYGFGISFIGVDNRRASFIIRDLKKRGLLGEERLSKYCLWAKSAEGADRSVCGKGSVTN